MLIVQDLQTHTQHWQSTRHRARTGTGSSERIRPGIIIMKFGEQLRTSVIREYQWYYIAYDELKQLLKTEWVERPSPENPKGRRNDWSEEDESRFIDRLEEELDKVHTKQKVKAIEISRRIATSDREVKDVVRRLENVGPVGSVPNDDAPTEEEFMMLEEDLSDIIADVHDLAKFVQLNYTGFQKIIKKHDKQTGWVLKPVFAARLKAKPFFKDNYEASIIKLSKLYDIVRTRGNPVKGDSAAGGTQGSFVRQTTKYWVHPDNVMEVKLLILKHLPVLVYKKNKEFEPEDASVTSIYYDNPEKWDLYMGRLQKTEGAEAIRLRWYGGMREEEIWVERKTHREDWTGEESVKDRFPLKEKFVNPFLRGEVRPADLFTKQREEGTLSPEKLAHYEKLAAEIQYSVLKKRYEPVCRSFYHRTAFQLPADARVRVSFDTELTMVREDNLDGRKRHGRNWRRMDIGVDWPFSQLPPEDIEKFPYAILEVKLQTHAGQEPPAWATELISSHLVEPVPKFSKFIHGIATMFPDRIKLIPFWLQQMDKDIRKPPLAHVGIQRPNHSPTGSTSDDEDDETDDEIEYGLSQGTTIAPSAQNGNGHSTTLAPNGDDNFQARGNMLDIEERLAALPTEDDQPLYDEDDEDLEADELEEARQVGGWTYYSKLPRKYVRNVRKIVVSGVQKIGLHDREADQINRFKAPRGKKVHVPVRVEPKVYFAAERTFLSWLEFSIYIGTIAVTLLNFGAKPTRTSFLAAGAFTIVAILALSYSVYIYLKRSKGLRTRAKIEYHDRVGPTVLCAALILAVVLNGVFEIKQRGLL